VLDPLTFIERLAAPVPRHRTHQLTYHGVLAPAAAWRDLVVPGSPARRLATARTPRQGLTWAELHERVFAIDVLTCPNCGGPRELIALLRAQLDEVASERQAGLLTVGVAGAFWSSSAATVAVIDALNHAYDVSEWRPWWKRRCVALGLTMTLVAFIVVSLSLILVGPDAARRVANWAGAEPAASAATTIPPL